MNKRVKNIELDLVKNAASNPTLTTRTVLSNLANKVVNETGNAWQ